MKVLRSISLVAAWVLSLVGTLWSLYWSNVLHWEPCTLCWYQRVCMYPLVLILGIAVYKNDSSAVRYALPLSSLGFLLALYQLGEQTLWHTSANVCTVSVPCTVEYFRWLGFITGPFLALVAFGMITVFLVAFRTSTYREGVKADVSTSEV